MPAPRPRPDLISDEYPDLARALRLADRLNAEERKTFLCDILRVVFSYQLTRDDALLAMLEADIRDIVRLRERPGFEKVLAVTGDERPEVPSFSVHA